MIMAHSQHKSFLMKYGTPTHQDNVVKSIANSPVMDRTWDDNATLEDAIKTGKRSFIHHVLNSKHVDVNSIHHIVKHGTDQDRTNLIDDESHFVRGDIAKFGNDEHRNKLINDKHEYVRGSVARNGTDTHREKLLDDPHSYVLDQIQKYGNREHYNYINTHKQEELGSYRIPFKAY